MPKLSTCRSRRWFVQHWCKFYHVNVMWEHWWKRHFLFLNKENSSKMSACIKVKGLHFKIVAMQLFYVSEKHQTTKCTISVFYTFCTLFGSVKWCKLLHLWHKDIKTCFKWRMEFLFEIHLHLYILYDNTMFHRC